MWVHGVGLNGLHAFYAHPAANQNQSTRVSVSVSARGGRQGVRSKESFSQFVEILELFKLQDAATDALLHRVPLPDSSGARPLCQERPQVHLQLPHRAVVVHRPQDSQVIGRSGEENDTCAFLDRVVPSSFRGNRFLRNNSYHSSLMLQLSNPRYNW